MALLSSDSGINSFLQGKSTLTIELYDHFVKEFAALGDISLHAAKTMIGISNGQKRIAWITQFGKSFLHVVLPFDQPYEDNLCFQKIALVPGTNQYNHHLRILDTADINDEVKAYLKLALNG